MVNLAMDHEQSFLFVTQRLRNRVKLQDVSLQCWSDGGHRHPGSSAAGAVVKGWNSSYEHPIVLAAVAEFLPDLSCTSMQAEVRGLDLASLLLQHVVSSRRMDVQAARLLLGDASAKEIGLDMGTNFDSGMS